MVIALNHNHAKTQKPAGQDPHCFLLVLYIVLHGNSLNPASKLDKNCGRV